MDSYEKNFLSQRPQELCKMCGKCCRVVTTMIPYDKLLELQAQGDIGAIDFLEIFEPYKSIEDAKKVDAEIVENIINRLNEDSVYDTSDLTFYKCRYLQDDNLCGRYESRKTLCKHFPSSPWAIVPPNCGFEGWLFERREEIKQKIRKTKEDLIELQLLKKKVTQQKDLDRIALVEHKMLSNIEHYKKYGSEDW